MNEQKPPLYFEYEGSIISPWHPQAMLKGLWILISDFMYVFWLSRFPVEIYNKNQKWQFVDIRGSLERAWTRSVLILRELAGIEK